MTATGPRHLARRRAHEAYRLRCQHQPWDRIAEKTGFKSAASAYKAVKRYIERMPAEDRAMARALAAGNYQIVMGELYTLAAMAKAEGNVPAATKAISEVAVVQERHVKLTGLQEPVAQKLDVTVHQTAAAVIDRAEAQLLELMATRPAVQAPTLEPQPPAVIDAEVVEVDEP